jgi:hypothetical protein
MLRATIVVFASLLAAVSCQIGLAEAPATQSSYATPADAINACQKALRANDAAAYLDCFTPDGQRQMVTTMIGILQMSGPPAEPATQPSDQETLALIKKYNLMQPRLPNETDDQYTDRVSASVTDPRAFLLDLGLVPDPSTNPSPPSEVQGPSLRN